MCRVHRTIQILDWTSYKGVLVWHTIAVDPWTHCRRTSLTNLRLWSQEGLYVDGTVLGLSPEVVVAEAPECVRV